MPGLKKKVPKNKIKKSNMMQNQRHSFIDHHMPTNVKVMQVNNINISKDQYVRGTNSSFDITFNNEKMSHPNMLDIQSLINKE